MGNLVNRIARDLFLPPADLNSLIRSAPRRYKVYPIPKRNGSGHRIIAQPTPAVKELQQWAAEKILSTFDVHEAATAYKKTASILKNAAIHKNSRFLLKLDFENFFNSITSRDFLAFLDRRNVGIDATDRELLCRILFWRPKGSAELVMSIGAPSSPTLCNILLYDFDVLVATYCAGASVSYTRYADDMTFSCDEPWRLNETEQWVARLVDQTDSPHLKINQAKTIHVSKNSSRRVTGLVLTNDGAVSLGRERKRELRAKVHRFLTRGMPEDEAASLRGWLAYVNSVEKSFITRLKAAYGPDKLARLGVH